MIFTHDNLWHSIPKLRIQEEQKTHMQQRFIKKFNIEEEKSIQSKQIKWEKDEQTYLALY